MQLPSLIFHPSTDVDRPPLFRSSLLRLIWRAYAQRLTRAGRWLFWPSGVLAAYAGASLQNQGYRAFAFIGGLWVVAWVATYLFRPKVKLSAAHADRICAGEVLPVDLEIEQLRGNVADMSVIPHRLPRGIEVVGDDGAEVAPLKKGQKARVRVELRCGRRGVYRLSGYRVETDFPMGVLKVAQRFEQERPLMVYPRFTRLGRLRLPTGRRYHPGGVALASSIGESFEYIGNREYRDGDNVRDIDWRATARLCRPIVREYRDEYFMRVAVVLDTHVPANAEGTLAAQLRECFERAVSLSAAVADYMARQEYLVDIFAAGPNLYHLTAGRSLAYLDQILDILACVEEKSEEPFEVIEPQIMELLSKITTVICVFLDWNESRRAFVTRLAQNGAGVKVIIVRDGKCALEPAADGDVLGEIPVLAGADVQRGVEEL